MNPWWHNFSNSYDGEETVRVAPFKGDMVGGSGLGASQGATSLVVSPLSLISPINCFVIKAFDVDEERDT